MTQPATLSAWLDEIERRHPQHHIELGLARIGAVYARLAIAPCCPVVAVTGTNGKGSTSAMIAAMLKAGGYRVGLYMSPHLLRYNERVRINGVEATDAMLCEAFAAVEQARTQPPEIALTYFEFGTLAAFWLFARSSLDAWVLEIGLGGRFDAVNLLDADVSVVTAIDIDHTSYLGDSRDAIGIEKAGIARLARPFICGDAAPPVSFVEEVRTIGAQARYIGRDFGAISPDDNDTHWCYWRREGEAIEKTMMEMPALTGRHQLDNAAMALAALDALPSLPLANMARDRGLRSVALDGRLQVVRRQPFILCDVAHNPHAARALNTFLNESERTAGRRYAIFAMLADKDIEGVVSCLRDEIDIWWLAPLPGPRGADTARLRSALAVNGIGGDAVREFPDVLSACREADTGLRKTDKILIFGSFLTVSVALRFYQANAPCR
ncbi:MAG: bifunctional tetrahydrofolate synthase/dihydrofolate synthase [Burkholderiales bacterium]|jgi:dihydrofolate synthase/folylpolyglutamate synthase|nr:bifunctional tetrahydrofolate synthase/dihydrofolate synthase [Burkholderiales bacterium]